MFNFFFHTQEDTFTSLADALVMPVDCREAPTCFWAVEPLDVILFTVQTTVRRRLSASSWSAVSSRKYISYFTCQQLHIVGCSDALD